MQLLAGPVNITTEKIQRKMDRTAVCGYRPYRQRLQQLLWGQTTPARGIDSLNSGDRL